MLTTFSLITLLILTITLAPLSKITHWAIRGLDFPRLQIAVLAVIVLVTEWIFLDMQSTSSQLLVGITGACLFWQLWWIAPYTVFWSQEVKSAPLDDNAGVQLTFLTSNVLTSNRNAEALIFLVSKHRPDVLVTLESDQWWEDKLEAVEREMPYSIKCPLDNLYGMHVYSRYPLENAETEYLVQDDVPSMHACIKLPAGIGVRAHFLHPAPPSPTENSRSKARDAELIMVAKSIAKSEQPIVVTGDLNDVAWSSTTRLFRKISGLLDPRIGRGMFNTFHADYPFLRWPLDHIFHSSHFMIEDIQRLPSIGSDHFPLLSRLRLSPKDKSADEGLEATQEDHEWKRDILLEEGVDERDVPTPGKPA